MHHKAIKLFYFVKRADDAKPNETDPMISSLKYVL